MSCLGFLSNLTIIRKCPSWEMCSRQQICLVNEYRRIAQPPKTVSIKVVTNPVQSWFIQDSAFSFNLLVFCCFRPGFLFLGLFADCKLHDQEASVQEGKDLPPG